MISKDIYESLGDKAYSELQKKSKDHKSKIKTIWDNKPWPLRGSYSNQQLLDLGFKRFEGGWKVPQSKFDELSEMTLRPLPTGKAEIPKVGEKKITEIDVYDKHKQVDGEPEEYTDSDEVEKQVMKSMHKDEVKKMLSGLTKIEKIVIITHFGLDNGKDYNLEQIGDMIGKSRERVRQIEAKALRKMRNKAMRNLNPEHIEEGKKFPRTSEFLFVRELEDIKRLAGVYEPYVEEGDGSMGSNISKTANKISNIMKEKNIQPGTPEWFQLWFSKPYLTGEKPYGE
jgi:RNA polymerase sigma factor (sigma-70 family)